jgi:uncharacterized protein
MTKPDFEARGQHVRLPIELREAEKGILVEGYAAVFNQDTNIGDFFIERIAPGAFSEAIGRDDVVFLINHDGLPLARTRSETLTLTEDDHGLKISTRLDPADPDVARIIGKMQRGDLDKMSFAFWATRQEWDDTVDPPVRTILEASLHDVSIVTTPAYDGTDIGLRSLKDARADNRKQNFSATRTRLRLKADLAQRENG